MTKQELTHIKLTLETLSKTGIRLEPHLQMYQKSISIIERELDKFPRLISKKRKLKEYEYEDLPDCVRLPR